MNNLNVWIESENPVIIAEIGMTHEGSLGLAMNMALEAKNSGATYVKFQTHYPDEESSIHDEWRVQFSLQDSTRYEYWKRTEFSDSEWVALSRYCNGIGIGFISSPFSVRSCKLLESLQMTAWKIGSGEMHNEELMEWVLDKSEPLILSSGLSNKDHIDSIIKIAKEKNPARKIILMHCISLYPTQASDIVIGELIELQGRFGDMCEIALSDHSAMIAPSILAIGLGVRVIEVHFTLSNEMFGPDVVASHNIKSLQRLVSEAKFAYTAINSSHTKDYILESSIRTKRIFSRSLCYSRNLPKGHTLNVDDLKYLKPGGGLPYDEKYKCIGKKLVTDVSSRNFVNKLELE
jgi:N,N'-diacetyllegionaminate synthase